MTLVKFNQKPFEKTISSLFEDLFQQVPSRLGNEEFGWPVQIGRTPVNIFENDQQYSLELVAPGFEKADFNVKLEKNLLTISAEKKEEAARPENEKPVRKEFSFRSFSRSFTVDDKIDAAKIAAKYENGVLLVTLPKKEEVKANPQSITVQ
jgi:HSP20 family protein